MLRATGVPPAEIATQIGVSERSLRRHFAAEMAHGKASIVARVSVTLVQKALKGDNACMFFYLRAHGGAAWNAPQKHEHAGPDGQPLSPPDLVVSWLPAKPPENA